MSYERLLLPDEKEKRIPEITISTTVGVAILLTLMSIADIRNKIESELKQTEEQTEKQTEEQRQHISTHFSPPDLEDINRRETAIRQNYLLAQQDLLATNSCYTPPRD